VTIYVVLLDEGSSSSRPTQAERVGDGLYRFLPTPDYDPEDEHWEFPPGSVVRAITKYYNDKEYLLAVKA
jgi:hypothetical protein